MRLVITCHLALAIILGPVLIAAAGAAAVANLTGSQTCTPNLCIRSILNPNTQTLTYTLTSVGSSAQQGWYAVGTGREMSGATMWVVWPGPDGSSVLLSERQGFGHRAPSLSSTPTTGTFVATSSFANTTGLTATWTVPFAGTPSSAYPLVWAVNPNNYPGTTASSSIIQHTDHGEITVDLTQPVEANGAVAQYDQRGTERYATLIKAHAVVMSLTWGLIAPLAILIARFGRGTSARWVVWHRTLQRLGTALLTTIGFALALAAIYSRPGPKTPSYTHEYIGIVLFVLVFPQLFGGWWIHRKYSADRLRRPARNWMHMIFGMGLLVLAWANMWLGIKLYDKGENWQKVVWGIWAAFLLILFCIGYAMIPRQLAREQRPKPSEMVSMNAMSTAPSSPSRDTWAANRQGSGGGDLGQSNVWARDSAGELDKIPMSSNVHISPTPEYQGVPETPYRA